MLWGLDRMMRIDDKSEQQQVAHFCEDDCCILNLRMTSFRG